MEKARFLSRHVPDGTAVEDPARTARLLDGGDGLLDGGDGPFAEVRSAVRAQVADDIIDDDPPQVWATARRLLALGHERTGVMGQLVIARTLAMQSSLADGERAVDPAEYAAALDRLPLPSVDEVEAALLEVVRSRQPVRWEEIDGPVLERLGREADDAVAQLVVDRVSESLIDDDGPLALVAGDRIVHVGDLTAGIVLTHRLTGPERDLDTLGLDFDLAGFARRRDLRLADGPELLDVSAGRGEVAWLGPSGWLAGHEEDALVAVRVDGDGVVTLDRLGGAPPLDPDLVALVRAVYDQAVFEPGLPVEAEDLVLDALVADQHAFGRPRPPLDDLCEAAGLERRGHEVAHDDEIWDNQRRLRRVHRVFDALGDKPQRQAATRVLDLAETPGPAPDALRRALASLTDPAVAEVVVDELVEAGDAAPFVQDLLAAATTQRQAGTAQWLAAVVAERGGDALVAEDHLGLALEADPTSAAVVERCAWYASDRGDARRAVHLWRQLVDPNRADLRTVEPFARRPGPKLGRNDACWCGSGRKYKTCHPGQEAPVPLAERVGWLCRKATSYLEHSGPEARDLVMTLAWARAVDDDDDDAVLAALQDPIVIDAALTEGGWFALFLEDRGPLLPDDEALLAQAWALVPRTVYEVLEVDPGRGLRVRDLATGDRIDVSERTFSGQASAGTFVCGRAVPDGEGHQFVGALFPVAPGTETTVLDLCDEGDPEAICEHVAGLHRPPVLTTREGEPLLACTAVLEVADLAPAQAVLDRCYTAEGDRWVEMHPINEDEEVVRATLSLDGTRLTVTTHSAPRVERVLALLGTELAGARLVSDERVPLRASELLGGARAAGGPGDPHPDADVDAGFARLDVDAIASIQERMEQRWTREPVPALGGLTPRQAADDPTRRDELARLIASFPDHVALPAGAFGLRPDHLRRLLGL